MKRLFHKYLDDEYCLIKFDGLYIIKPFREVWKTNTMGQVRYNLTHDLVPLFADSIVDLKVLIEEWINSKNMGDDASFDWFWVKQNLTIENLNFNMKLIEYPKMIYVSRNDAHDY